MSISRWLILAALLAPYAAPGLAAAEEECPMHRAAMASTGASAGAVDSSMEPSLDVRMARPIPTPVSASAFGWTQISCPHRAHGDMGLSVSCDDCCCVRSAPQKGSLGANTGPDAAFPAQDIYVIFHGSYPAHIRASWPSQEPSAPPPAPPPNFRL